MKKLVQTLFFLTFFLPFVHAQEDAKDKARRGFINAFLTYYQGAYEREDINYIESFFSANIYYARRVVDGNALYFVGQQGAV